MAQSIQCLLSTTLLDEAQDLTPRTLVHSCHSRAQEVEAGGGAIPQGHLNYLFRPAWDSYNQNKRGIFHSLFHGSLNVF